MSDELELIEEVVKKVDGLTLKQKKDAEDLKKSMEEGMKAELKEQSEANKKWMDDLHAKVEEINKDIADKGATVKQLQDELAEFKANRGRLKTALGEDVEQTKSLLSKAFGDEFDKIKIQANKPSARHEFEMKTVGNMTAANNLTGAVQATYSTTPALRGRQRVNFRDLVNVISSATGLWKFYRQNKPVGEGSMGFQTTHAAPKAQVDYDFTEVTVTVDYLAGFVRIAKQMLQDLPFMQSFVSNELVEDYLRSESAAFFGQLYSAAAGNPAAAASAVTVEKIIQVAADLAESDYDANGAVVTNSVWAKILLTKPSDYSLPGGSAVSITPNGDVMIVGIPIIRTKASNIGDDRILMGDWTKAAIIQTEGLNVNMYEQDSDNVQRNLITVKAEARVALATLRTDAFTYFPAGTT